MGRRKGTLLDLAMTEAVLLAIAAERDRVRALDALQTARVALAPSPIANAMRALENATYKAATARKNLLAAIAEEGRARA